MEASCLLGLLGLVLVMPGQSAVIKRERTAWRHALNKRQVHSSDGSCPETGVQIRINGLYCPQAIQQFGSFVCYRHELASRDCCLACRRIKDSTRPGCEYGDQSSQCSQIQPSDCYDTRNRQICCSSCDRLRTSPVKPGCEYGDLTPSCQQIQQNPGLCYFPENQRICCDSCGRLQDSSRPDCPYGNQNDALCEPFDPSGNLRVDCYTDQIRRACCNTCGRLQARMPAATPPDCQYGDRPVTFNIPSLGTLNCTSLFRYMERSQCQENPAIASNCCYTCRRMLQQAPPDRRRPREG